MTIFVLDRLSLLLFSLRSSKFESQYLLPKFVIKTKFAVKVFFTYAETEKKKKTEQIIGRIRSDVAADGITVT